MTDNSPQGPFGDPAAERIEEETSPDQRDADDARNAEIDSTTASDSEVDPEVDEDVDEDEETSVDEVEQELLDAMKKLRGANRKVEQYLDGLARDAEKPAPEKTPDQASGQSPEQAPDQVEKPAE